MSITVTCDREGCDEEAESESWGEGHPEDDTPTVIAWLPQGWGFDWAGRHDRALHCPDHRDPS